VVRTTAWSGLRRGYHQPPERIVIVLKHRPLWQRALLFPGLFLAHLRVFRRCGTPVWTSLVASWGLARLVFLRLPR